MNFPLPWRVQIEPVEGCNRLCTFCGLTGIRDGSGAPYRFMEYDLAAKVSQSAGVNFPGKLLTIAGRGEPTLHPRYLDIIKVCRENMAESHFVLITNGAMMRGGKMEGVCRDIFDAGVDVLVLDTYPPEQDELLASLKAMKAKAKDIKVYDFFRDKCECPSPFYNHRRKVTRTLVAMGDLAVTMGKSRQRIVYNRGGHVKGMEISRPRRGKCINPFREISVTYDGKVHLCCGDYGRDYVCGDASTTDMKEIWYGEAFVAARKALFHKLRKFSPCSRCNFDGGGRQGLLPKMDFPDAKDREVIRRVVNESGHESRLEQQYLFGEADEWQ